MAVEPRRAEGRPGQEARQASARRRSNVRSWRPWSTLCRPASDWLHEYKYDGYRLLLATGGGAATALTRNGNDWSDKFRGIVRAAAELPAGCLIDGEAVALDDNGKPSFQLLQATLKGGKAPTSPSTPSTCWSIRARTSASCPISSARSGWRRCSRRPARRSSMATMSSARARPCSTPSARKAARGSSRRRPARPIAARAAATGSRSNASSGRNSSSSAGGQRQAPRLPLAAASPCAKAQADLCRQGRDRLRHQDDR